MAIIEHKNAPTRVVLDLAGPDGNAFALIGYAQQFGRDLGWSKEEIAGIRADMQSSDYEHLVRVFDQHFGAYADLILPPGMTLTDISAPSSPKAP